MSNPPKNSNDTFMSIDKRGGEAVYFGPEGTDVDPEPRGPYTGPGSDAARSEFELLLAAIPRIGAAVAKVPAELRTRAFDLLVRRLEDEIDAQLPDPAPLANGNQRGQWGESVKDSKK